MSSSARPQWDQFNFSVLILLDSLLKLDKMEYTHFHLEDVRVCCDVFEVFREIQRCFQNCTLHAWLQALIPTISKGIPDVNCWLKQNRASEWIIKAEIDQYWCTMGSNYFGICTFSMCCLIAQWVWLNLCSVNCVNFQGPFNMILYIKHQTCPVNSYHGYRK